MYHPIPTRGPVPPEVLALLNPTDKGTLELISITKKEEISKLYASLVSKSVCDSFFLDQIHNPFGSTRLAVTRVMFKYLPENIYALPVNEWPLSIPMDYAEKCAAEIFLRPQDREHIDLLTYFLCHGYYTLKAMAKVIEKVHGKFTRKSCSIYQVVKVLLTENPGLIPTIHEWDSRRGEFSYFIASISFFFRATTKSTVFFKHEIETVVRLYEMNLSLYSHFEDYLQAGDTRVC